MNQTQETKDDLADFLKDVDERFGTGPDTNRAGCMTRDPVVTIITVAPEGSDWKIVKGVKEEGCDFPMSDTALAAWLSFKAAFEEYAEDRIGPIYWRMKPELHQEEDKYYVRARLFIDTVPLRRRVGRFYITHQQLTEYPCQVMEIMSKCVVLKAESLYHRDVIEYVAISPCFAVIPEGNEGAYYAWIKDEGDEWVAT